MPPPPSQYPLQGYNPGNDDLTSSPRAKRARFHSAGDVGSSTTVFQAYDLHGRPRSFDSTALMSSTKTGTVSFHTGVPTGSAAATLTPGTSVHSDESQNPFSSKTPPPIRPDSPTIRRLSVQSLLRDDNSELGLTEIEVPQLSLDKTVYGVDRGFPDLDLPKNNDAVALNGMTPTVRSPESSRGSTHPVELDETADEFGFGYYGTDESVQNDTYYRQPVTVSIPRSLGPLPATLLENPMNLLYFHHFLNHTARILVPHDCDLNPFRSILPRSMTPG